MLASCDPTPSALQNLLDACQRAMRAQRLAQPMQEAFLTALHEITRLILVQADPPPNRFIVELSQEDGYWTLEVRDDGGPLSDPLVIRAQDGPPLSRRLLEHFAETSYTSGNGIAPNCLRVRLPEQQTRPRIAVVDDDTSQRQLIEMYLHRDYEVLSFADAHTALTALETEPVDLLISDINMPGMDGLTFRRRLAERSETDLLPFIFITANDDETLLDRAGDLGVDDYLLKPVRKRQLLASIRRVLSRSRKIRERLGDLLSRDLAVTLRPELPARLGRFHCALRTRAASAGGGDLLVHRGDAHTTSLILANVTGQDGRAKFFAHLHAGYLSGLIRALPPTAGPAETLTRLSRTVEADPILQATLATCLCIWLHEDGRVRIAGAGHPLPLLVSASGTAFLDTKGVPPGLLKTAEYTETSLRLGPGRRLLLYTGGLVETGDRLAREHLRLAARETAGYSLEAAADHIMGFADTLDRDGDATLVLLEDAGPQP